ncbi:MAG TPA: DNA-3-methyladenine glycosylase I [Mycobacteriales bacterium]|jgi:DNA-3-methyladenine glycosylase I|nr:DNA-3-methyladenine glycosylase I [Mycobacteriales bacterium]
MTRGPSNGEDGQPRCPWALSAPEYVAYHDEEWGRRLTSDDAMFERMSLEGFQSGLSWLIILRKRPGFRAAFANFSIPAVAEFGPPDVERLLIDTGIVRNRAKIEATIANASAVADLPGGLLSFVSDFAPTGRRKAPRTLDELPGKTPESLAMAKALKAHGVRFIGPTTAYALMQATGLVNDHLAGCIAR